MCDRVFFGTDSTPHAIGNKEDSCGCAEPAPEDKPSRTYIYIFELSVLPGMLSMAGLSVSESCFASSYIIPIILCVLSMFFHWCIILYFNSLNIINYDRTFAESELITTGRESTSEKISLSNFL